eukprot:769921_1
MPASGHNKDRDTFKFNVVSSSCTPAHGIASNQHAAEHAFRVDVNVSIQQLDRQNEAFHWYYLCADPKTPSQITYARTQNSISYGITYANTSQTSHVSPYEGNAVHVCYLPTIDLPNVSIDLP